ncbi:unnamed protein product [Blepharisma stoltei]|uniref:Uncharacterized protein n=1 Tax=Blepharisma stoltei TaxID=1481888 RepID=A0AAU9JDY4_9CILI|nr:unnamed protein product [Blepharisma stoltei]
MKASSYWELAPSYPMSPLINPADPFRDEESFPIPKTETPYSWAKRAEYIEKNLEKAEFYYKMAIANGERVESAIKDLAGIFHQQGKTKSACDLLMAYRHLYMNDLARFDNLLLSLQKQIKPTGNSLNKCIKISGLPLNSNQESVKALFGDGFRIKGIELTEQLWQEKIVMIAMISFSSHSAARKTVESYRHTEGYCLEWATLEGEVVGPINIKKKNMEFSYFAGGKVDNQLQEGVYEYTYFPENSFADSEDLVDDLLRTSILSYMGEESQIDLLKNPK